MQPLDVSPSSFRLLHAPPSPGLRVQDVYLTRDRTITPIKFHLDDVDLVSIEPDSPPPEPFSLQKLPIELRNEVYRNVLFGNRRHPSKTGRRRRVRLEDSEKSRLGLLRSNKQIHEEATIVLYGEVTFHLVISSRHILFLNKDYGQTEFNARYLSLIKRIRIQIKSPNPDIRGEEGEALQDNVRNVCMQLADNPSLHHLALEFGLDNYNYDSTGSSNDESDEGEFSGTRIDCNKILRIFGRLRNIRKVIITANKCFVEDKIGKNYWTRLMTGNDPAPAAKKTERMFRALKILGCALDDRVGDGDLSKARECMEVDDIEGFKKARMRYLELAEYRFNRISQARSALWDHDS